VTAPCHSLEPDFSRAAMPNQHANCGDIAASAPVIRINPPSPILLITADVAEAGPCIIPALSVSFPGDARLGVFEIQLPWRGGRGSALELADCPTASAHSSEHDRAMRVPWTSEVH
jgi:hypothetical protein